MPKRKTQVVGEHRMHRTLWNGAQTLRDIALGMDEGSFYPGLAASLFVYLAFEGFLNDLGTRLFPEAWEFERQRFSAGKYAGTLGKLDFIAEGCRLDLNKAKRPYQTLKALHSARDSLVHAKLERFDKMVHHGAKNSPRVTPKVFAFGEAAYIERAISDVEAIADSLITAAHRAFPDEACELPQSAFQGAITTEWCWLPADPTTD